MASLADLVPMPPVINVGLSACREDHMLGKFGKPGALTPTCTPPTGPVKDRIRYGVDVGPFKASGLDYAVESLMQVFSALARDQPEAYAAVHTAGMLCVRQIHISPAHFSNHSWGTAIDLYFGSGVVPQGSRLTQRGFLALYAAFNAHGWFWGAGFAGMAVDTMHFELADETVAQIGAAPLAASALVAAADYRVQRGYDQIDHA